MTIYTPVAHVLKFGLIPTMKTCLALPSFPQYLPRQDSIICFGGDEIFECLFRVSPQASCVT